MGMSQPDDADALREAERRIEWVLAHPGMSVWLKDALRTALDRDPIDILNELEMLRVLLTPRTDAMIRRGLGLLD
jgi:hypothetical protein